MEIGISKIFLSLFSLQSKNWFYRKGTAEAVFFVFPRLKSDFNQGKTGFFSRAEYDTLVVWHTKRLSGWKFMRS